MAGETILVTGVSGFVGAAVARTFAGAGWRVRGLVRASSPRANLRAFPGAIVEGDMRDEGAVARALEGCAGLAHVAADYRLWARDPEEIVRANREGTAATMRAARSSRVGRIVYTSSVATIPPRPHAAADETAPLDPDAVVGAYKRSKAIAERIVADMVADGLPAVIVNPSTPIGPRDVKPTPTGRILVDAATGRTPAYVDTGLNLVHVDDVAAGHLAAFERGAIGRRYILGGEDVPLKDLLAELARQTGRRPARVKLPVRPLIPLAHAAEAWARVTGREPRLTLDTLRMAGHHMYYSSARAKAELGYAARPWQQAVADALGWFRAEGMIR
ncbi:hopanoid-associated sugar epimerase [Sphingomonas sp.]|uniref:hopanoid-associated sugar epimerase n=1 Tax=Sphingomonas sp. TaxID=28214 RepID=UPI003B00FF3A